MSPTALKVTSAWRQEAAAKARASVCRYVEARGFAGYDPYDAMNSPLLRALTLGTKKGRIGWTQLLRRLPFNLRPVLGIHPEVNPKAAGLFLGAYTKLQRIQPSPETLETIEFLVRRLGALRSPNCTGSGWGYNFDWQSRAAFVPKGTPTIVNTAFVGHALLDAYEAVGSTEALALARPAGDFMLRDLKRSPSSIGFCFSYTPLDENFVHNANLLGASLLIRLHSLTGEASYREAAQASLAYSLGHQRENGSWPYAETHFQNWCDSFHTGFNLQAIRVFLRCGQAPHATEAYQHGVNYYASHFFLPDGTPKYYDQATYPIDIHAPAQAIAFFSTEGSAYDDLTDLVLEWMLTNLYSVEGGYFYFRRGRFMVNRLPYMRWGQAWGLHALATYGLARACPSELRVW